MNLVVIIIDTLRKDYIGCYGNDWIRTPSIDALARESVLYHAGVSGINPHNTCSARNSHRKSSFPVCGPPVAQRRYRAYAGLGANRGRTDHPRRSVASRRISHRIRHRRIAPVQAGHELSPGLRSVHIRARAGIRPLRVSRHYPRYRSGPVFGAR